MEEDNKKNEDNQPNRKETLFEGEEFGPEAFETEEDDAGTEAEVQQDKPAAAAKSSRLPWLLFAASLVAIIVILVAGKGGAGGMNGAAATVNGEKVTKEELYQSMLKQGGDAALDNLITQKLINQEAAKKKIQVSDADIENELKDIKAQFQNDESKFNDALKQNNLTLDALKSQISTQLKVNKIFEGQMDLSDAKQKEYFDKNKENYGTPEQIEVSHILVEKKEDAEKLLTQLKGGADFAALAKANSTDPGSKDNGGSLGLVARNQGLDQAFEDAAFKLGKGEISGVVQSSFGFHIIKVTDKKPAVTASYDDKKVQVRKDMVSEEVNTKASEWLQKLKTDAKIEKL